MLLAIDVGTSSTRALLYDLTGNLIEIAQENLNQNYPNNGWVEQCANEMWQKTLVVLKKLLAKANIKANQIKACGITNQRETTILWDKNSGEVLAPAIVWQDRRTTSICQRYQDKAKKIYEKTGLVLDPYFSATKILWLRENNSNIRKKMDKGECLFGTVDTFILWHLTKGKSHLTDATNASRTLLYDLEKGCWDDELLDLFQVPKNILPTICDSNAYFGDIDATWLGEKIAITGICGDQQAATLGQNCLSSGEIKATFGTGCFTVLNTKQSKVLSKHRLLSTVLYQINGEMTYGLEGSIFSAGTSVKWLRDKLQLIKKAADTEDFAKKVIDNHDVYFIPAFTGLGAPFWQPNRRAAFLGLTLDCDKYTMTRAVLDALCFQVKALIDAKEEDLNQSISVLKVDGGMSVNDWLMQHLANLLGICVIRQKHAEVTASGVALLAGLGCGEFNRLDDFFVFYKKDKVFYPQRGCSKIQETYRNWLDLVKKEVIYPRYLEVPSF